MTYCILKSVISSETCAVLSDYVRFKASIKKKTNQDDALKGVHREYGDPLMESFLLKIQPNIEQALGKKLWPTLAFYYLYQHGDKLEPHKDRSSCEFVASVYLGCDDAFKNNQQQWPLILDEHGPIELHAGDVLLFEGHTTKHWRESFQGEWFVSAIFAYVDQNGPYAFQKYDQRQSLGKPHVGMLKWLFGCLKNRVC